jgi:hypothetical protein
LSFVGERGGPTDYGYNYAGGTFAGAGVVAGGANEACEFTAAILGGSNNTIGDVRGGFYGSYQSTISGGAANDIAESGYAFIGGGSQNLIGLAPPYNTAGGSAIVAGYGNTVASPADIIGAGEQNTMVAASTEENPTGGQDAFIGAGYGNSVGSYAGGIGSGEANSVAADYSAIDGGYQNRIRTARAVLAEGQSSFIGAGLKNNVSSNFAGILGGQSNSVTADHAAILGGQGNTTSGQFSSIGGGYTNAVTGTFAAIGGGYANAARGLVATVGGGYANSASGQNATVPGGVRNTAAGRDSFAAGDGSQAKHDGTFVWSDEATGAKTLASTASNQFLVRASGGYALYSSPRLNSGVKLEPGSGSWSSLSDRYSKTAIADVDGARILAKVAALPVSEWSYRAESGGVRHLGPMAQDFRAAFGLGEDDRHISTVDEEGVALAAIKALQSEVVEKDAQIAQLRRAQADADQRLESKYARLERRLDALAHLTSQNSSKIKS